MAVLQRRLQILLDQERYDALAGEAQRTGRSVAAIIREAIDVRFARGQAQRAAAIDRFLALTEANKDEPSMSAKEIKDALDRDLGEYFDRLYEQ